MAVLAHFFEIAPKPSHSYTTFPLNGYQSLDITMEGGRAGPGGDCEASGEAPLQSPVGSSTKRSGVGRRARVITHWRYLSRDPLAPISRDPLAPFNTSTTGGTESTGSFRACSLVPFDIA